MRPIIRSSTLRWFIFFLVGFYSTGCNVTKFYVRNVDRKYDRLGFQKHDLKTDSLNLHYLTGGTGEPLLMIQGFGGDGEITWSKQIKALREHYFVIVPDLLWFGQSSAVNKPSLGVQARSMTLLLDSLKIESADVVGMSYGGFVAFEMCRRNPQDLNKMIIVDSPGPVYRVEEVSEIVKNANADSIEQVFVPEDYQQLKLVFDVTFRKPKHIPGLIRKQIYQQFFSKYRQERLELLDELRMNAPIYQQTKVPENLPVCIIWGEDDRVFPLQNGVRLADTLNAPITVIPKAGHGVNSDQTKKFNAALSKCLQH